LWTSGKHARRSRAAVSASSSLPARTCLGRGVGGGDQVILIIGSSELRKELGFAARCCKRRTANAFKLKKEASLVLDPAR
jgi:hypothetical protein